MAGGGGSPCLHKNSDFLNGRQMLVVFFFHPENDTVLHPIVGFLVPSYALKCWIFFTPAPPSIPQFHTKKIFAEVGYLHLDPGRF
jgi:hypothetical protein